MMFDVIALGELLIDFTLQSVDDAAYPTMAAHPGGAPANYLAALSKLGASTAMLGKVGRDSFGRLLVNTLRSAGIETEGLILDGDVFTTLAFVTLDETGNREFSFARKPGADTQLRAEDLRLDMIDAARVLHFGSLSLTDEPSRSATREAVAYAKSHGKLISCDPNLRKPLWSDLEEAKRQILWCLEQADVVKISDEEVDFLWGLDPMDAAEKILHEYGARLVFVTCGADGCCYANPKCSGRVSCLPGIQVVDTTGAGDIFGGSAMWFLLQLGKAPETLSGEELHQLTLFASTAAGLSATRPGGLSSVPSLEEIHQNLCRWE